MGKVEDQDAPGMDENGAGDSESVAQMDFSSNATTKSGTKWNTKIVSLNVNGFRAWLKVSKLFRYLQNPSRLLLNKICHQMLTILF